MVGIKPEPSLTEPDPYAGGRGSGDLLYMELFCWNAIIAVLCDVMLDFILRGAHLPTTLIGTRCLTTTRNYCN